MTSRPVRRLPASKETVSSRRMIPSRSYHHEASGLPMISLMLSSSNSGSIGRRNGRINSKLMAGALTAREAQRLAGLPRVKSKGLCSRFLLGHFIVILIFRGGLFGTVQLQDRSDPNFPDALLLARLLAVVLPAAQFAFHLDMCALGERLGELRELAEDYATVPLGVRDVLVVLPVGRLGCQREGGKAAVVGGASFCIAAEKTNQGYFVLVHDSVSPFV